MINKQTIFILSFLLLFGCKQKDTNGETYSIVDEMPEFIGGQNELYKFINKNIKYQSGVNDSMPGFEACINFIVEIDGTLTNIENVNKVLNCPNCDKEAIRLIKSMPKWKPAKHNGELVRCSFNLFVPFKSVR